MRFQFSKTTGLSFGASLMAIAAVGIMPSTASAQSNPDAECVLTEDQANPTLAGANATGDDALACGGDATARGDGATAVGSGAVAIDTDTSAFGNQANATGLGATAYGASSNAVGENAHAIGYSSQATQRNATAVGAFSSATGVSSFSAGVKCARFGLCGAGVGTQFYRRRCIFPGDWGKFVFGRGKLSGHRPRLGRFG